jgi:hypothetical protein
VVGTVDVVHGRTLGQGGANAGGSGHLLGLLAPVELVAWPAAPPVWLSSARWGWQWQWLQPR